MNDLFPSVCLQKNGTSLKRELFPSHFDMEKEHILKEDKKK